MNDISHAISFLKMAVKAIKQGRLYTARATVQVAALEIDELIRRRSDNEVATEKQQSLAFVPPQEQPL